MLKKVWAALVSLCLLWPISVYAQDTLYLGGDSIGIELQYEGIRITGTYPFLVDKKMYDPSDQLQAGDTILSVNQQRVTTLDELYAQLNQYQNAINEIPLIIQRGSNQLARSLKTTYDASTHSFKSGLYVKDRLVGVGTLTYYDPQYQSYGALGHEIIDSDTKQLADIHQGSLYPARILSISKAQNDVPGEKHGQIDFTQRFASVVKNTPIGIYGHYQQTLQQPQVLPWAHHEEVTTGDACMYTVVHDQRIEAFHITITKVHKQDRGGVKGIEFTIADDRLASLSNGIVQGMSGSPIVQNGKIIGAVTHVVTAHPHNGYGVFIEWMLQESRNT